MSLSKKQKLIIKRSKRALTTLLINEYPLIEMLYSPFMTEKQVTRTACSRQDEDTIQRLLDFIKLGTSCWDGYYLENLIDKYAYNFGYTKVSLKKKK